jgi:hypothetical protein
MGGHRTRVVNCIVDAGPSSEGGQDDATAALASIGGAAAVLESFDVQNAHCSSAGDEAKLRRVIESESAESFNAAIREVATLIKEVAREPLRASPSRLVRASMRGFTDTENPLGGANHAAASDETEADKETRAQFLALDRNNDGRLCRSDLTHAFAGALEQTQVDDLLGVIATGPELRVNGTLSIGLPEFTAWIRRAQ